MTATWDNTATGDNNTEISSVTVDFSAFGGDTAVAATASSGIWSATYEVNGSSVSGSNLNVSVTASATSGSTTGVDTSNASVDALLPTIESVTSSTADGTYAAGGSISIQVDFSEAVTVTGVAGLRMETGAIDRLATYSSGRGTDTLSFVYSVQTDDNSGDLDYASINALETGSGTIGDTAGNSANRLLATPGSTGSLGASKALVVAAGSPPSGGGGGGGGSSGVTSISQPFTNLGTLVNPVITVTGSVEGGFLSGAVSNAGLIRNVSLRAGTIVQGGRLGGTIVGDPAGPALINASITAGTVLSNVVIAASALIDSDAIMGANVSFETLANIPPGMDLSTAQGGSPWQRDSGVSALDLDHSLVVTSAHRQSLLEAVRMLNQFSSGAVVVTGDELSVRVDQSRSRLLPVALHRAASGAEPGATIDEDGHMRIVTDSGLQLTSLPLIEDVETLRRVTEQAASRLTLGFDPSGGIEVRSGQNDVWFGKGDVVAVAVAANTPTGIVADLQKSPAGVWGYSLVYMAADGVLYRQHISPVPAHWSSLKSTLQSTSGVSEVKLDADGFITLKLDGIMHRARAGYELIRSEKGQSSGDTVILDPVGDLNGDGRTDFRMHYPDGDTQVLYILP